MSNQSLVCVCSRFIYFLHRPWLPDNWSTLLRPTNDLQVECLFRILHSTVQFSIVGICNLSVNIIFVWRYDRQRDRDGLCYGEDWKVWKVPVARVSPDSVYCDNLRLANLRKIVEPEQKPQLALNTCSELELHPSRGGVLVQPGQSPAGAGGEVGPRDGRQS